MPKIINFTKKFLELFLLIFSILLLIFSSLPLFPSSHWIFRSADFGKIQLFFLALLGMILCLAFAPKPFQASPALLICVSVVLFQSMYLFPYTRLFPSKHKIPQEKNADSVTLISANVYQFNTEYDRFIQLIQKYQPDFFLTMESNQKWVEAFEELQEPYPHTHFCTLENTYGMHLYSKIPLEEAKTHFFIADDIPSFEITLKDRNHREFKFFGLHPPPPSPTEEETSKERDGDLLSAAKRVKEVQVPSIICGDFNNVAWSKSSKLFRKISHTLDPRLGNGFHPTFHAKYWWLRFPIDLLFHSKEIEILELKTLPAFGSDHLALYCSFDISEINVSINETPDAADQEEQDEADEMITEGKMEDGDRDTVAKEY